MVTSVKRLFVGNPLKTDQATHERLTKKTALAVFSSDALSSTAYATEEILLVLASAVAFGQTSTFRYVMPISIGIAVLLIIVATSYRQTIHAYPSGGGAYIVAKENLGVTPGLIAGAALLVDYILTVSVSIAAGVAAITSMVQGTRFAWLDEHKVMLCLIFIAFIAVANLRGVRESGSLFAAPTYAFLGCFLFMIGYGIFHYFTIGGGEAPVRTEDALKVAEGYNYQPVTLFLILGAFSNGCAALTGIEAISNGVPAFKKPEARNASATLVVMAALLTTMFLGTSVMAYLYHVQPHASETVISQFGRIIFTGAFRWFYYVVQITTALILVLAANTSFADFPRLASLLARDRFLPRQFANRGDKLVFSNGIVILAILSGVLVVGFGGDTSRLIPLYAVGVFLSFTLSQGGMVRHWLKERANVRAKTAAFKEEEERQSSKKSGNPGHALPDAQLALAETHAPYFVSDEVTNASHWKKSIVINGLGAVATFIVLCVFVMTKFIHGAWIVVLLIPLLVLMFRSIHKHYARVANQLSTEGIEPLHEIKNTVIVPISGIHRGVINALEYAKSITSGRVRAIYVDFDEEATHRLQEKWKRWGSGVELVVLQSPYRSLTRPLLRYIERLRRKQDNDFVTVVLPEFVPARWWQQLLHNQSSLLLKGSLLFKKGVIVTSVPYHLEH